MVINKFFKSSQKYLSKLFVNKKENVHLYNKQESINQIHVTMKKERKSPRANTKKAQIYAHLLDHGSITSWEAIELYAATRLSAVIFELRDFGKTTNSYEINTVMVDFVDKLGNQNEHAKYVFKKF